MASAVSMARISIKMELNGYMAYGITWQHSDSSGAASRNIVAKKIITRAPIKRYGISIAKNSSIVAAYVAYQ